ncbi:MAG: hypothetical protein ABFS45_23760, partial [Pseudomonadota bacterium]
LIHLLRRNFFLRYMDVRSLTKGGGGSLTARDLTIYCRINPFVSCIGGHAVRPCSNLHEVVPEISYITLLRDPVERYLSQYRYWVEKLNKEITFDRFLDHRPAWNFQVSKIAGTGKLEYAKKLLDDRFLMVGTVERFDEFLVLLKGRLRPFDFDSTYRKKNIAKSEGMWAGELLDKYGMQIMERNELDSELYRYVTDVMLPMEIDAYGDEFAADVKHQRQANRISAAAEAKSHTDYVFRKIYCQPITGLVR